MRRNEIVSSATVHRKSSHSREKHEDTNRSEEPRWGAQRLTGEGALEAEDETVSTAHVRLGGGLWREVNKIIQTQEPWKGFKVLISVGAH